MTRACVGNKGNSLGFHVGQWLLDVNHGGPWSHVLEERSVVLVMPLVSRSAGLSDVGQYRLEAEG